MSAEPVPQKTSADIGRREVSRVRSAPSKVWECSSLATGAAPAQAASGPPQEAPHVALELLVCEVPVQVAQPEGVRARRAHRASAIRRDLRGLCCVRTLDFALGDGWQELATRPKRSSTSPLPKSNKKTTICVLLVGRVRRGVRHNAVPPSVQASKRSTSSIRRCRSPRLLTANRSGLHQGSVRSGTIWGRCGLDLGSILGPSRVHLGSIPKRSVGAPGDALCLPSPVRG